MGVSGDFAQLAKLRGQLARLGARGLAAVSKQVSLEAQALVTEGFAAGKSPSGAPWAPVRRGGQPLRDSGRLLTSLTPQDTGRGFVLATNVAYASVHQYGATISAKRARVLGTPSRGFFGVRVAVPARPFLPEGDTLPAAWAGRIEEAAVEAIEHFFR